MFNISNDTKTEAVAAMKEILGQDIPDEKVMAALEEAIRVVAKSFGM